MDREQVLQDGPRMLTYRAIARAIRLELSTAGCWVDGSAAPSKG
jgi:hypothetical protein